MDIPSKIHRFLHSRILLYAVFGILALKVISALIYLPISYNVFFADVTKTDLINLLNQNRQSLGLDVLAESEKLNEAAYLKAQDMVKNSYFSHQSPQGVTPWFWFKRAGYDYQYAGENLAVGFADSVVLYDAWVNSPSHRANLLNKNFSQIGTAIATGFQGNSIIVVQLFGTPKAVTAITENPKPETLNPNEAVVENPVPIEENLQETASPSVAPAVLSQSTERISGPENAGKNNLYLRFLNFMVYENTRLLTWLSLVLLVAVAGCLLVNGMLMWQVQNRLILLRPLLLVAVLALSMVINKNMGAAVMPYQIII